MVGVLALPYCEINRAIIHRVALIPKLIIYERDSINKQNNEWNWYLFKIDHI